MSDTRALLNRITAFRERLERTSPLLSLPDLPASIANRAAAQADALSRSLRQLSGTANADGPTPVLTSRARNLLERARDLIGVQKRLSDDPILAALSVTPPTTAGPDPLVAYHRSTVALTEAALRLVQAFPDSAEVQLRMCEGVETMLGMLRERLGVAEYALALRRTETERIDRLAHLLEALAAGQMVQVRPFAELAEVVLEDTRRGIPLRFLTGQTSPARYIAACALTTAQVVARIVPHDYEWAGRPLLPVVVTLMMDVGMMRVPAAVLMKAGPLDAAERRLIERHPLDGAEMIRRCVPDAGPLVETILAHHERPDGTGYPNAIRGDSVGSLPRLLAVCSEYAAMASDRPHRLAHDPRTALTDTLMAAEQGRLDRDMTEYLLNLSFHPVGTVVELTDGRVAVVAATHTSRVNLRATARPVVAVLADANRILLARPEFLDLAAAERGGVDRALPTAERRKLLAERYPDLC